MALMAHYKPGQGRQARTLAAVISLLVLAWGCYAFFEYGNSKLDRLLGFSKPLFSKPLDIVGGGQSLTAWITPSFLAALVFFLAGYIWLRGMLNRPKTADHLIGTELEMRRVKWPSKAQVARAGAMVVYYTFWLAVIIFVLDLLIASTVGWLLGKNFLNSGVGRLFSGLASLFSGG